MVSKVGVLNDYRMNTQFPWVWLGLQFLLLMTWVAAAAAETKLLRSYDFAGPAHSGHAIEVDAFGGTQGDSFTIVINAFKRDDLLEKGLTHWMNCTEPTEIAVIWNDAGRSIPSFLSNLLEAEPRLHVYKPATSNLTNRFFPRSFDTQALFSVDDDVLYECSVVQHAFEVWQTHPEKLVGFHPRIMHEDGMYTGGPDGANLVFITKGGFAHKRWYERFFLDKFSHLRDLVNTAITGEDILMSYIHASASQGQGSILLPTGRYQELDLNGPRSLQHRTSNERLKVTKAIISQLGFPLLQLLKMSPPALLSSHPYNHHHYRASDSGI